MPLHRITRQRTGNHRKVPLRDCQEQYRWKRGLDTLEISLQSALQTQILCCTRLTQSVVAQAAELMAEADLVLDPVVRARYYEDARALLSIQNEVVRPVTDYYFEQEGYLADISPDDDEADHNYGPPRNRTINDLSEYEARRYTRFSKDELRRMFRLFRIGDGSIRIRCSTTQNRHYLFTGEEIFLFGLAKLATGDYSDKLYMDLFVYITSFWHFFNNFK